MTQGFGDPKAEPDPLIVNHCIGLYYTDLMLTSVDKHGNSYLIEMIYIKKLKWRL